MVTNFDIYVLIIFMYFINQSLGVNVGGKTRVQIQVA